MAEIRPEEMAKLVSVARILNDADKSLRALFIGNGATSKIEIAYGEVLDVLYAISGEQLGPEQDFGYDSKTVKLVMNRMIECDQVGVMLDKVSKENRKAKEPKFYSRDEIERFLEENGGYSVSTGYVPPKELGEE